MSTDAFGLGRLDRVGDLREIWKHESDDFAPWLATNIDMLSDTIGMPLTVVDQLVAGSGSGPDIHAADPEGRAVVIDNQLEPSSHANLGQLLIHTGDLEASTAIWITTRFHDEHRRALTWLNERADVRAFGIELSVARIGDSAKAPVLDVVVEPSNWPRISDRPPATVSPKTQSRMAFFEEVFTVLAGYYPAIRTPRPQADNWCPFASGPFGHYALTFSKQGYRVEIFLDTGHHDSTKHIFDQLHAHRDEVHQHLGFPLTWDRLDTRRGSRMATYLDNFDLPTSDEETRQQAVDWSITRAKTLHIQLDERLRQLAKDTSP